MKTSSLKEKILTKIRSRGPITFCDFMQLCLYDQEFGYYTKRNIIGKKGDFVTSPHCSPLFSRLVANQFIEFWELLGGNEFVILEMGAGTGFFAKDLFEYLKNHPIYNKINYVIVEQNISMRTTHQKLLSGFLQKVKWVDSIEDVEPFYGCVFSNELIDAFPVHLIQKHSDKFYEIYIDIDQDNFIQRPGELSSELLREYILANIPSDLPDGYLTEVNLKIKPWFKAISERLLGGFVLTIDYGHTSKEFFSPLRNRGTLLCYKSHHVSDDFFAYPGEQDMTAHVNFSDLHKIGLEFGFSTMGYAQQWAFLGALDFEKTLRETYPNITPFSPEMAGVKMLIFPQGMGSSHKVMVQAKGVKMNNTLKGFCLQNKIETL